MSTKFVEKDFTMKCKYYENKYVYDDFFTYEAFSNMNNKNKTSGRISLNVYDIDNDKRIKMEVKRALMYCEYSRYGFEIYLINNKFSNVVKNVKNFLGEKALKRIGL